MRGAVLDLASLGPDDLELSPLLGRLEQWNVHAATAAAEVAARIAGADVVLCNKTRLDRAAFAAAPSLRLVVVMATGTDNIDLQAAAEHGVTVCNARGYATSSLAEHTLMLMLALLRRLPSYQASVAAGEWSRSPHFSLHAHPIVELRGCRLGIVGFGVLGAAVAKLAAAFGMEIALARLPGYEATPAPFSRMPLEELLPWADVLSLHCPLTLHTRGLIGATEFARMKHGAILVNTARGALVDTAALLDALASGRLSGAGIDVLEREPPPPDDPLLLARHPNLIVTPHIAWASRAARQRLIEQLGEIIGAWRAGEPINRVV